MTTVMFKERPWKMGDYESESLNKIGAGTILFAQCAQSFAHSNIIAYIGLIALVFVMKHHAEKLPKQTRPFPKQFPVREVVLSAPVFILGLLYLWAVACNWLPR